MGMFDRIEVHKEIALPYPNDFGNFDFSELEFQTKCLENCLSDYILKKDGLYLLEDGKLVNKQFHGVLDFGAYYTTDLIDYLIDFRAKYTDGTLVEVKLHRFQKFFHESTKEKFKILKDREEKRRKNIFLRLQSFFVRFIGLKSKWLGVFEKDNTIISLYSPKLILLRKRDFRGCYSYGLMLENFDFGFKFSFSHHDNVFCIKFFGFGFELRKFLSPLFEDFINEKT